MKIIDENLIAVITSGGARLKRGVIHASWVVA